MSGADDVLVSVRFFAALRELAGVEVHTCPLPQGSGLADLLADLGAAFGPALVDALQEPNVRVAVNQTLIEIGSSANTSLQTGDEVAFLPPVTGG